jgi:hypothetical protein
MSRPIDGSRLPAALPSLPSLGNKLTSTLLANAQANQIDRIKQGVTNGSISEAEASKLLAQQARMASSISAAQADGKVSLMELAQLKHQQLRAGLSLFEATINAARGQPKLDPAATQRQAAQLSSIAEGVRSGSLTSTETAALLNDQAEISTQMGASRADKNVNPDEWLGHIIRQEEAQGAIDASKTDASKAPHAK